MATQHLVAFLNGTNPRPPSLSLSLSPAPTRPMHTLLLHAPFAILITLSCIPTLGSLPKPPRSRSPRLLSSPENALLLHTPPARRNHPLILHTPTTRIELSAERWLQRGNVKLIRQHYQALITQPLIVALVKRNRSSESPVSD